VSERRVGVIGTGAMGGPIVLTLRRSGWEVLIAPRDPRKVTDLVDAGARVVADPAAIAAETDTILLSLPDAPAVRAVLFGPSGVVTVPGWRGLVVDTSTLAPEDSRAIAQEAGQRGIATLDAPVSGGPRGAANGTLSVMVGGPDEAVARARPLLEAIGSRVIHCGGVGAGQVTKACNQLIVMSTVVAVAETLRLAEHAGVDPWVVREALLGGYAASPILELQGARILREDHVPGGRAIFHAKDIATIDRLATQHELELPLFETVRERFERLFATEGGPDLDHSAVALLYPRPAAGDRDAA
jgi:2-hydroxy-3-oxopropionate reductase